MTVISFPPSPPRTIESPQSSAVHLDELARRAYSFGFPLVMMDMAREAMQSGEGDAQAFAIPVLHCESASSPLSSELAEMPPCTVFACAWLDLCREPVIVSAPDTAGRYYAAHALDAWSDVCASFGARTNAGRSRNYALVGPLWQGRLPDGVVKLRANTPIVWLQIRLHASDARDRSAACALLDRFHLSRLSEWGEASQRRVFKLERTPEGVADGVMALSACEFYQRLCALMVDNPPSAADLEIMTELRLLGVERTRSFDFRSLPWRAKAALGASLENQRERLMERTGRLAPLRLVNGWRIVRNTCRFVDDYDRRAYLALQGLRARDTADCIAAVARVDDRGEALRGARAYELAFGPDDLPPANAFWTLSARTADAKSVLSAALEGPELKSARGGGAIVRIQRLRPEGKANWLPVNVGEFALALELHWPADEALEGRWRPPAVRRIE
jgi:hypothetical protein